MDLQVAAKEAPSDDELQGEGEKGHRMAERDFQDPLHTFSGRESHLDRAADAAARLATDTSSLLPLPPPSRWARQASTAARSRVAARAALSSASTCDSVTDTRRPPVASGAVALQSPGWSMMSK